MKSAIHSAEAANELLENIVILTEQRDQLSLEYSLFHALEDTLRPASLQVIELRADTAAVRLIHASSDAVVEAAILDAARDLDADSHRQLRGERDEYLLLRIEPAQQQSRHVLILAMPQWNAGEQRLALGMLQVYRNYVRLLFDSERDTLTGLQNRKNFEGRLADLVTARLNGRRSEDKARDDFLAMLDIDRFKAINDRHGHLIGDEVLLAFANVMRESLRDVDQVFRYGGEEFVILLEDMSLELAVKVLDRLRDNVARHAFPQVGQVTVSIGYTSLEQGKPPTQIIEEADRALYFAKEHGRDQVRGFADLHQPPRASGSAELF